MINIISKENLKNIQDITLEIMGLIKANKFFFSCEYNSDQRVKPSSSLLEIYRALPSKNHRFTTITTAENENIQTLETLVINLYGLLLNKTQFATHKLKDYSLDIEPKLCRELVSELEDLFILNEISFTDIEHVYNKLGKNLPKKFSKNVLDLNGEKVYSAIRKEIRESAQEIKANSITHYENMVNRIDPENEIKTAKEFIKIGRKKISDMDSLRLCIAYKFHNEKFYELIDDEFNNIVSFTASRISSHYAFCNDNEQTGVEVRSIHVGGKGFDIVMDANNILINARAVTVQGPYVRFHYRYIIT